MASNNMICDNEIAPYLVCIPVCGNEESLFDATLQSIVSNTVTETSILVISLGANQELLSFYKEKTVSFGKKIHWIIVEVLEPCLPFLAICHLPSQYSNYDVILVLPGVEVPQGWDARLALAAMENEKIASVSPLCDISPLFALLDQGCTNDLDFLVIDNLVYALGQKRNIEVPVLLCGCVYLRRLALDMVWPGLLNRKIPGLGKFCGALAKEFNFIGFHNVCCDHVYIMDRNATHFTEMEKISVWEEVQLINQKHPFADVRQAVKDALVVGSSESIDSIYRQPAQLHVIHTWGGGQEHWLRNYCESDTKRINLVLRSISAWGGKRLALYRSYHMDTPLRYWDLYYPIRSTVTTHLQYKAILQEIIDEFGVEIIIVSSLIGHSLDIINTDIKTIFITHDYYPFCHAINIYFDGICKQCTEARLEQCFVENEQNRYIANVTPLEWYGMRNYFTGLLLNSNIHLVSPSESVTRHMKALIPELQDKKFEIIPHGVNLKPSVASMDIHHTNRFRVLILGSLVLHKGRKLFEEIYPKLHNKMDFYLVGCGEEGEVFAEEHGIYIIPEYAHQQLPEIVARINPHIGLLLSIVPETYSYTLSELWILGVPIVATNVGSFKDRVINGINGFTCQPISADIIEKINLILENPALLDQLKRRLANFKHRTAGEMVEDYHALAPLPEFSFRRYFSKRANSVEAPPETLPLLIINPQARFINVIQEFQQYVLNKLMTSPRFSQWQKKLLVIIAGAGCKLTDAVAKMFPIR